ncbi:MAG: hypothetical protein B7Z02_09780 [Rhodobacterales bacterium 32-67-9]|nr:MAG: hypothetical protein B7Z02_09780 [Rhodobacterales bacterium 32-67-9]
MSDAALAIARTEWALGAAQITLVAARENRVYRVDRPGGPSLALRLHRPGYRSEAELRSEMQWIEWLGRHGAVDLSGERTPDGRYTVAVDGFQMTLVPWLTGRPLNEAIGSQTTEERVATFRHVGRRMALLHDISDRWTPPKGFTRPRWDVSGLVGDTPLWGRFWENPGLDAAARGLILTARDAARSELAGVAGELDHGLVHADLVRENILLTDHGPSFIDFDDGGWGFRIFDLATALTPVRREADFTALLAALLSGYREVRPIDSTHLPLFLMLRSFTYLGWIIERMGEAGAGARNDRFVANATTLARAWLGNRTPVPD